MANNATPGAGAQADSVAHQIWRQQFDQYYWYYMSEYIPHVPWQNQYAQQSILAYSHPTHDQEQSLQPVSHSGPYSSDLAFCYAAQAAQTSAPQHNPYVISTPHYAIHPYSHSTPAMPSHPYYPQHYGTSTYSHKEGT